MTSPRCAVCKHCRRSCPSDCIFSPYFPPSDPQRFLCLYEVYGMSNVAKILQRVPVDKRAHTIESLYFEAQCRKNDRVYGSVGVVCWLQQQLFKVQAELAKTQAKITFYRSSLEEQQHHFHAVAAPLDLPEFELEHGEMDQLPDLPSRSRLSSYTTAN